MHDPDCSTTAFTNEPLLRRRGSWRTMFVAALVAAAGFVAWAAIQQPAGTDDMSQTTDAAETPAAEKERPEEQERFLSQRRQMVRQQLQGRDITDRRVLEVMERVRRHRFVPESWQDSAYEDHPLPIGRGQTISQPYIVALMTQLAQPQPKSRALDVGTGSGYQAALLAELCQDVYSIEIVEPLAKEARQRLAELGYKNVQVRGGDGYRGWAEQAPFDIILVAAAPDHVPQRLVEQLAPGGRLVIPVGRPYQDLLVFEKQADGETRRWKVTDVAFVPMTGEALKKRTKE